jgi:hypothetical protein
MSLLTRGTEVVKVFQESEVPDTDSDGNTNTRAPKVGTFIRAVVQPVGPPTENQDSGFNTQSRYRLKLVNYPNILRVQSQIEWRGKRYSIVGDGMVYSGSSRTAHVDYVISRS